MKSQNENPITDYFVIYLHGFASGPKSSKAVYFAKELNELGISTAIPDLNQPDFERMTLTTQLQAVNSAIKNTPQEKQLVIIGSSMGGLLATLIAPETKNLAAMILLAPGFGLKKRWPILIGDDNLKLWKKNGSLDVFNYAVGEKRPLSYRFFEDINNYETDELKVDVPTLIFHGKSDETVPLSASKASHSPVRNQVLYRSAPTG